MYRKRRVRAATKAQRPGRGRGAVSCYCYVLSGVQYIPRQSQSFFAKSTSEQPTGKTSSLIARGTRSAIPIAPHVLPRVIAIELPAGTAYDSLIHETDGREPLGDPDNVYRRRHDVSRKAPILGSYIDHQSLLVS